MRRLNGSGVCRRAHLPALEQTRLPARLCLLKSVIPVRVSVAALVWEQPSEPLRKPWEKVLCVSLHLLRHQTPPAHWQVSPVVLHRALLLCPSSQIWSMLNINQPPRMEREEENEERQNLGASILCVPLGREFIADRGGGSLPWQLVGQRWSQPTPRSPGLCSVRVF